MGNTGGLPVPGSGPGGATPALVNLVCTGAKLNYAAYAATILDLAGRGYLSAIESPPGSLFIQVPGAQPAGELTSYEQVALDRTAQLAGGAGVPFEVLAGAAAADDSVWDSFAADVRSSGKNAGLTRQILPASAPGWITAAVIVVLLIVVLAVHPRHLSTASNVLGAVIVVVILCLPFVFRRLEGTSRAGKELAAAYQGRARGTAGDLSGCAYAFAAGRPVPIRGATPAQVSGMRRRAIGLTADRRSQRPRQAWSSASGQWRLVRIGGYSRRPGPGEIVWAFWAILLGYIAVMIRNIGTSGGAGLLIMAGLLTLCALAALQAIRSLRRWLDYRATKEVAGQVIARWAERYVTEDSDVTSHYLAVDDGHRAWPLRNVAGDDGTIRPGDQVRVRVVRSASELLSHTPAVGEIPSGFG